MLHFLMVTILLSLFSFTQLQSALPDKDAFAKDTPLRFTEFLDSVQKDRALSKVDQYFWNKFTSEEVDELQMRYQETFSLQTLNHLGLIKLYLINGNLKSAKKMVESLPEESKIAMILGAYYLAVIYFVEGRYDKSYQILKHHLYSHPRYFATICHLRINLMLILYKDPIYKIDYTTIEKENFLCELKNINYSSTHFEWTNLIIKSLNPKLQNSKNNFTPLFHENDQIEDSILRIWLKFALFRNDFKSIQALLNVIKGPSLFDKKILELLLFTYYRNQNVPLVKELLNSVSTVNSYNIQGNLALMDQKQELAYGHFQLALKKKNNSLNAILRIVPITLILKKWSEGEQYARRLPTTKKSEGEKLTLIAFFQTMQGKYQEAYKKLLFIRHLYQDSPPLEVLKLLSFNAFILGHFKDYKFYLNAACFLNEGISCSEKMESNLFPDFQNVIHSPPSFDKKESELNVETLREEMKQDPLTDENFINQKEIEELDNQLFEIPYLNGVNPRSNEGEIKEVKEVKKEEVKEEGNNEEENLE